MRPGDKNTIDNEPLFARDLGLELCTLRDLLHVRGCGDKCGHCLRCYELGDLIESQILALGGVMQHSPRARAPIRCVRDTRYNSAPRGSQFSYDSHDLREWLKEAAQRRIRALDTLVSSVEAR